jgi:hypothetical protein
MKPGDVRAEIASLLNGKAGDRTAAAGSENGVQRAARAPESAAPAGKAAKAPAKAGAGAGAKSKAKKR